MTYNVSDSCFLIPGLSQSACAAWVQAWGSIGAIASAVWLGHRSEAKAANGAMGYYVLFKAAVRDSIRDVRRAAELADRAGLRYGQAAIEDAVHLGQNLPLHLLPGLHALTAAGFRTVAARASAAIGTALIADWPAPELALLKAELDAMVRDLDRLDGLLAADADSE